MKLFPLFALFQLTYCALGGDTNQIRYRKIFSFLLFPHPQRSPTVALKKSSVSQIYLNGKKLYLACIFASNHELQSRNCLQKKGYSSLFALSQKPFFFLDALASLRSVLSLSDSFLLVKYQYRKCQVSTMLKYQSVIYVINKNLH